MYSVDALRLYLRPVQLAKAHLQKVLREQRHVSDSMLKDEGYEVEPLEDSRFHLDDFGMPCGRIPQLQSVCQRWLSSQQEAWCCIAQQACQAQQHLMVAYAWAYMVCLLASHPF